MLEREDPVEQESQQWQDDDESGEERLEMPAVRRLSPALQEDRKRCHHAGHHLRRLKESTFTVS